MFTRIDHVAITTKDRQKSIEFYESNFGFKKYFEHDVPASQVPNPRKGGTPRELSKNEILRIIEAFQNAARRVKEAGFSTYRAWTGLPNTPWAASKSASERVG